MKVNKAWQTFNSLEGFHHPQEGCVHLTWCPTWLLLYLLLSMPRNTMRADDIVRGCIEQH
jgi:hypothetical protein